MFLFYDAFPDYLENHFTIEKSYESSVFKLSLFVISGSWSLFLNELAFKLGFLAVHGDGGGVLLLQSNSIHILLSSCNISIRHIGHGTCL